MLAVGGQHPELKSLWDRWQTARSTHRDLLQAVKDEEFDIVAQKKESEQALEAPRRNCKGCMSELRRVGVVLQSSKNALAASQHVQVLCASGACPGASTLEKLISDLSLRVESLPAELRQSATAVLTGWAAIGGLSAQEDAARRSYEASQRALDALIVSHDAAFSDKSILDRLRPRQQACKEGKDAVLQAQAAMFEAAHLLEGAGGGASGRGAGTHAGQQQGGSVRVAALFQEALSAPEQDITDGIEQLRLLHRLLSAVGFVIDEGAASVANTTCADTATTGSAAVANGASQPVASQRRRLGAEALVELEDVLSGEIGAVQAASRLCALPEQPLLYVAGGASQTPHENNIFEGCGSFAEQIQELLDWNETVFGSPDGPEEWGEESDSASDHGTGDASLRGGDAASTANESTRYTVRQELWDVVMGYCTPVEYLIRHRRDAMAYITKLGEEAIQELAGGTSDGDAGAEKEVGGPIMGAAHEAVVLLTTRTQAPAAAAVMQARAPPDTAAPVHRIIREIQNELSGRVCLTQPVLDLASVMVTDTIADAEDRSYPRAVDRSAAWKAFPAENLGAVPLPPALTPSCLQQAEHMRRYVEQAFKLPHGHDLAHWLTSYAPTAQGGRVALLPVVWALRRVLVGEMPAARALYVSNVVLSYQPPIDAEMAAVMTWNDVALSEQQENAWAHSDVSDSSIGMQQRWYASDLWMVARGSMTALQYIDRHREHAIEHLQEEAARVDKRAGQEGAGSASSEVHSVAQRLDAALQLAQAFALDVSLLEQVWRVVEEALSVAEFQSWIQAEAGRLRRLHPAAVIMREPQLHNLSEAGANDERFATPTNDDRASIPTQVDVLDDLDVPVQRRTIKKAHFHVDVPASSAHIARPTFVAASDSAFAQSSPSGGSNVDSAGARPAVQAVAGVQQAYRPNSSSGQPPGALVLPSSSRAAWGRSSSIIDLLEVDDLLSDASPGSVAG